MFVKLDSQLVKLILITLKYSKFKRALMNKKRSATISDLLLHLMLFR